MALSNKRSVITLFSNKNDFYCHQVVIALCEKGVNFSVIEVESNQEAPEELIDLNPYGTLPTLVDRDLVLYEPKVILEYLDERFPHPPLLPVYPIARAQYRSQLYRIEKDWYTLADAIKEGPEKQKASNTKALKQSIVSCTPIFDQFNYFFSEEYSLVDCYIAPLLWQIKELGVELPPQAEAIDKYAKKIFARPAFQKSLEHVEKKNW